MNNSDKNDEGAMKVVGLILCMYLTLTICSYIASHIPKQPASTSSPTIAHSLEIREKKTISGRIQKVELSEKITTIRKKVFPKQLTIQFDNSSIITFAEVSVNMQFYVGQDIEITYYTDTAHQNHIIDLIIHISQSEKAEK